MLGITGEGEVGIESAAEVGIESVSENWDTMLFRIHFLFTLVAK